MSEKKQLISINEGNFRNPPAEIRPLQIIHCFEYMGTTSEQIEDGLKKLIELGIGGIVCNVGWNTKPQEHKGALYVAQETLDHPDRYLISEDAWSIFLMGLKKAKEMGFKLWLYDEEGYPSGGAGGLTLKNHPEYQARGIFAIKCEGTGKNKTIIDLPNDAEKFVYAHLYPIQDGNIQIQGSQKADFTSTCVKTDGIDGSWVLVAFAEKTMFEGTHSQHNVASERKYINILSADAIKRFIRITHEAYFRSINEDLWKNIEAIFTDEPSLMVCYLNTPKEFEYAVIPWEDRLPDRFKEMHGYDIFANLYALFGGDSSYEMHVRLHFHQTIGDMLASNYFGLIADWCKEHGINSSGHLLLEERIIHHVGFSGDLMSCLRKMQSPGIDILTSKPERIIKDSWFMTPKYAGSVANLMGREVVMSETSGHIESVTGVRWTLQDMIGTANIQYLLGVNTITSYYPWSRFYSDSGNDDQQDPLYKKENYIKYNEYVGRLGVMLKGAKHVADIGLYYPVESIQAYFLPSKRALGTETQPQFAQRIQENLYDISLNLLREGWDFDFLDAKAIQDEFMYKVIIMPSMKVVPADVLNKLLEFEKQGGILIWAGELPDLGASKLEDDIVKQIMQNYKSQGGIDKLSEKHNRRVEIEKMPAEASVFIGHYIKDSKNIHFIINIEPDDIEITVRKCPGDNVKIYNPLDGLISDINLPSKMSIAGYGSVFLVEQKS